MPATVEAKIFGPSLLWAWNLAFFVTDRVGITGGLGVGPPVQLATPDPYIFMNWVVGSNPLSWPQLSVYSCARAPTTLVLAKLYVSRQTSMK
jgi:hypothetical protein